MECLDRRALFQKLRATAQAPKPSRPATGDRHRGELVVARRAMACEVSIVFPAGERGAVDAGCAALDEVDRLEERLSIFRSGSDLAYLNRHAGEGPVRASAEVYGVVRRALQLSEATGGAFDVASGALVRAWGFSGVPTTARQVPRPEEIQAARYASGWRYVHLDESEYSIAFLRRGLEVNLGGIGKGHALDCALDVARRDFGIASALMQGGQSSVKAIGTPRGESRGWTVAIGDPLTDPRQPVRPLATIRLRDRALGTSGATNQFFTQDGRRFGHILDPRTGWPAQGVFSASAVAPSAAEADALSTAFYVMGFEAAYQYCREHPDVGAVMVVPGPKPGKSAQVRIAGAVEVEVRL
jgi:FAD:protein FMN transferase